MQAFLDPAEKCFKLNLVEKESAIGSKMAQLNKTFPTNDCVMCTISPNLAKTGRHSNIEILINTEIVDIVGEASFSVHLQHNPRYGDKRLSTSQQPANFAHKESPTSC